MRSMVSWWIKIFPSLFITFRTNLRLRLFPSPCSFLFVLHFYWSLIEMAKKKIKCSFYSCEFVFHFSLWLKLSIFFRLVLFPLKMYNRSGKKLTGKNIIVDSSSKMYSLWSYCWKKGVGRGQYQFLGKIVAHFLGFHLLRPLLKWKYLYISPTTFYYNFLHPPPF